MTGRLLSLESHWDWRRSAYFRIGSLVSLWAVILMMGTLGAFLVPLAALRTSASFGQAALNIRLGTKTPVEKQTKFDWFLVGGIFAGGEVAAVLAHVTGNFHSPLLYIPMLLPFSLLQWRMTARSFVAYDQQRAAKIVAFRLNRVVQRAA